MNMKFIIISKYINIKMLNICKFKFIILKEKIII